MTEVTDNDLIVIVDKIKDLFIDNTEILGLLDKTLKGNKTAAQKLRVKSVEIDKLLKEFRAKSAKALPL